MDPCVLMSEEEEEEEEEDWQCNDDVKQSSIDRLSTGPISVHDPDRSKADRRSSASELTCFKSRPILATRSIL
jgi:hypothetical protein